MQHVCAVDQNRGKTRAENRREWQRNCVGCWLAGMVTRLGRLETTFSSSRYVVQLGPRCPYLSAFYMSEKELNIEYSLLYQLSSCLARSQNLLWTDLRLGGQEESVDSVEKCEAVLISEERDEPGYVQSPSASVLKEKKKRRR
ncbi:leukemia NUP98 fusion partner 1 isoform X3 [Cavia porcellus]|uniref:leukemia NUP98 fusion partner 1 isoform X3 n=1 Tax=Cavia porcellus TaxID=10141 RepID=UPI002FE0E32E